jgi:hypothetical protein
MPGAPASRNATGAADAGFSLLATFQRRGHRPSGSYDIESAEDYARLIYERIYDKPDRLRKLEGALTRTVGEWLGLSESSLDRYRVRFGIGIRDIRRRRVPRPN